VRDDELARRVGAAAPRDSVKPRQMLIRTLTSRTYAVPAPQLPMARRADRTVRAGCVKHTRPTRCCCLRERHLERWSLEQRNAEHHRVAAAQARKLRAEATTRPLKERLEGEIAWHEQIAEEIERASAPDADAASPETETPALSSETPGR